VAHASITMALTIQPTTLEAIARNISFRGRGLLARFLYALPPNNVGRRKVGLPPVDPATIDAYTTFVQQLAVELDQWGSDPAKLIIEPAAAELLLEYETALEPRLGPEGDLAVIADWGSKVVGQTIRLAGLLHLTGPDALRQPIGKDAMSRALQLTGYYTEHARAAFIALGADQTTLDAQVVLDYLRRHELEQFSVRDLHTKLGTSRFRKADNLKAALDLLEDHLWVTRLPAPEVHGAGRRPSPVYKVTQSAESTQ
jgi:hypothetical protein